MVQFSAMSEPTPKRGPGRPRTGVTPKRNIRIGRVWDDAAAIAAARGETMTTVVERLLQRYVARNRIDQSADTDQGSDMSRSAP